MSSYYGIDLGTTQCLVAQFQKNPFTDEDELSCLSDPDTGEEELPSVVSFLGDNEYIAGARALARLYREPDATVELVKVRLGNTDTIPVQVPGQGLTEKAPQEIASLLLKTLIETRGKSIRSALLTVPAFFNQSQREATKQAGTLAGMDTENQVMIEEPTAAIIYQIYEDYARHQTSYLERLKSGEKVLVFDFGGGTLDLSVVEVTWDGDAVHSKVLAHGGDSNLGGNVIDFLLTDFILRRLHRDYPKDQEVTDALNAFRPYLKRYLEDHVLRFDEGVTDRVKQNIFITKRNAEACKIRLTSQDRVMVEVPFTNCERFPLSRSDFENAILNHEDLNLRERISDTLIDIAEKVPNPNRVLLVGGSSQIPYIREIILSIFDDMSVGENMIETSFDCMHAVVLGAAIQQALRQGESILPFRTNYCRNIVSRNILLGCGNNELQRMAERGSAYPFLKDAEKVITIPHALSENVSFALYEETEKSGNKFETLISTYEYYLPLYYTGEQIHVHLNIGEDGIYQVSATYEPMQETVFFETKKEHMLTEKQMESIGRTVTKMTLR